MSIQKTPLQTGKYYHIYNRGINSCDLFRENENYEYFMALYDKYISPVANTYAWVLMKNHFHLLVEILPEDCWELPHPEGFKNLRGLETDKRVNQQFSMHIPKLSTNATSVQEVCLNIRSGESMWIQLII